MKSPRPITDRIQDKLWSIRARRTGSALADAHEGTASHQSISGTMAWPQACLAFADGRLPSTGFRRLRAVMEVVETLGPCDGRHHARAIREHGHAAWFDHPAVRTLAAWGNPMCWPGFLMGTPRSFPPTTLRYLSHALWLHDQGMIPENAHVVEIGVGYGGLAAMNSIVSHARTTLVDLPEVERAAMKMLRETGLKNAATPAPTSPDLDPVDCVISNYAFTELSSELQDIMITTYLSAARHGMILSNARSFSDHIGGRSNEEILAALADHGIQATCHRQHPLLSPADEHCEAVLIAW